MGKFIKKLITIEQVENLTTQRLLSYYKKNGSQWTNIVSKNELPTGYHISEKEFNERKEYWKKVKEILNKREDIEPKKRKI